MSSFSPLGTIVSTSSASGRWSFPRGFVTRTTLLLLSATLADCVKARRRAALAGATASQ
jgi:hypothetical protein